MPNTAAKCIDFIILGGAVAGLACAIALRRVGHHVVVLEQSETLNEAPKGCQLPPNLTKILFKWGLEPQLRKIAQKAQALDILIYETGEHLGTHRWDEMLLEETMGDYICTHHEEFRKLLYDTAVSHGADVRMGAEVKSIDPFTGTVVLASDQVIRGDIIVGADGRQGLSRKLLSDDEDAQSSINVFIATIPKESIMQDPELAELYGKNLVSTHNGLNWRDGFSAMKSTMFSWFGNERSAFAYPMGSKHELALSVFYPNDGNEGSWENEAPYEALQKVLATGESKLQKLGKLAINPFCMPVVECPDLDSWIHESGRMVVIGEAAHPLPPGFIQSAALTVEDGAALAYLFSHLQDEEQIETLLEGFSELRHSRCSDVRQKEMNDIYFMLLPPGEAQRTRDEVMRAKGASGMDTDSQWSQVEVVFGYNAEDDAENWWVAWGLLRERAKGIDVRLVHNTVPLPVPV